MKEERRKKEGRLYAGRLLYFRLVIAIWMHWYYAFLQKKELKSEVWRENVCY